MINIDIYYLDLIRAAMGIITGIGGGLIRDALTAKVPSVFADPTMPYLPLAICLGIYVAKSMGFESREGSCLGVVLIHAGWMHFSNTSRIDIASLKHSN